MLARPLTRPPRFAATCRRMRQDRLLLQESFFILNFRAASIRQKIASKKRLEWMASLCPMQDDAHKKLVE
jgi:hypothetical protein